MNAIEESPDVAQPVNALTPVPDPVNPSGRVKAKAAKTEVMVEDDITKREGKKLEKEVEKIEDWKERTKKPMEIVDDKHTEVFEGKHEFFVKTSVEGIRPLWTEPFDDSSDKAVKNAVENSAKFGTAFDDNSIKCTESNDDRPKVGNVNFFDAIHNDDILEVQQDPRFSRNVMRDSTDEGIITPASELGLHEDEELFDGGPVFGESRYNSITLNIASSVHNQVRFHSGHTNVVVKNEETINTLFRLLNATMIPRLIPLAKWFTNVLSSTWIVGQVYSLTRSRDDVIRKIYVENFNYTEEKSRYINRTVWNPGLFGFEGNYFMRYMAEVEKMKARATFSNQFILPIKFNFREVVRRTVKISKLMRQSGYEHMSENYFRLILVRNDNDTRNPDIPEKNIFDIFINENSELSETEKQLLNFKGVDELYIDDEDIALALWMLYKLVGKEVGRFNKKELFSKVSVGKNGYMFWRSSVLEMDSQFKTPLLDKYSSTAYSIASYLHNQVRFLLGPKDVMVKAEWFTEKLSSSWTGSNVYSVTRMKAGVVRTVCVKYINHTEDKPRFIDKILWRLVRLLNIENSYMRDMTDEQMMMQENKAEVVKQFSL